MSKTCHSVPWKTLDRINASLEGLPGRGVVFVSRPRDRSSFDKDRSGGCYAEPSGDAVQGMWLNDGRTCKIREQRVENRRKNVHREHNDSRQPRSSRAGSHSWTQQKSSRGLTYYFNHGTNRSQWEIPEGFHVKTPKSVPDGSGCTRSDGGVVNRESRIPKNPSPVPTNEYFAEPARGPFKSNFSAESMPLREQMFLPSHDHNIGTNVSFRRVTRISGTPSPQNTGESGVCKRKTSSKDVHSLNAAFPEKTRTKERRCSGIEALELQARQLATEILENKRRIKAVSDSLREAKLRSRIERMQCYLKTRRQKALEHEISNLELDSEFKQT